MPSEVPDASQAQAWLFREEALPPTPTTHCPALPPSPETEKIGEKPACHRATQGRSEHWRRRVKLHQELQLR